MQRREYGNGIASLEARLQTAAETAPWRLKTLNDEREGDGSGVPRAAETTRL